MRELFSDDEIILLCKALSSRVRLGMVRYIGEEKNVGMNELAEKFGISGAAVTQNVRALKAADVVEVKAAAPGSTAKLCSLKENRFVLEMLGNIGYENMYEVEIPIGQYTSYEVYPTCGIATTESLVGEVDDPRYFAFPARSQAGILWSSRGYFEYILPNVLKSNQVPTEIQLSMELSSEAPGVAEKWPSDIYFHFNGESMGYWTSPGDFGKVSGVYTPGWWFPNWNQYGILKLLSINEDGIFIDGLKISDTKISDMNLNSQSEFRFRVGVPAEAKNVGGLTLFGSGFGNYNQDIRLRVFYREQTKR